jgi:hypothetical protein
MVPAWPASITVNDFDEENIFIKLADDKKLGRINILDDSTMNQKYFNRTIMG